jgi:hypothetical protein
VRNETSGSDAITAPLPDGSFAALVRLAPGRNSVQIRAHARSGLEASRVLDLVWDPDERSSVPSIEKLRVHNDLLALHLNALRSRAFAARTVSIEVEPRPGN